MTAKQIDVCIVGGGAAGLTIARRLADIGAAVLVLERGGLRPGPALDDSYDVQLVGATHRGVHEGRFRAWGGSTTRWGGQLWPWDPEEFEARPYLNVPGWPIPFQTVNPYYKKALDLVAITEARFDAEVARIEGVPLPELTANRFRVKFSKWLPWSHRNFSRSIGKAIRSSSNVDVALETTAIRLVANSSGEKVVAVRARLGGGKEWLFRANAFVLAGGTVETIRLLFASSVSDRELGNHSDWLGRGFMDHLSAAAGLLRPTNRKHFEDVFAPFYARGILHTPRMVPQSTLVRSEKLAGFYAHFVSTWPNDSAVTILRDKFRQLQFGGLPQLSWKETRSLASGAFELALLGSRAVLTGRRPFPSEAQIELRIDAEQLPNPDSRIFLAGGEDQFGLPRLALDWGPTVEDVRTLRRGAELITEELAQARIGSVLRLGDASWRDRITDIYHMMGGTRMAASRSDGVVDTNCRVFDTDNLYIASGSVFPTAGTGNPTLTIMALALRLADHLMAQGSSN